jgi:hypothetical protein
LGDGIYTAEDPVASQKYGDVGLLVVRLPGTQKVGSSSDSFYGRGNNSIIGHQGATMVLQKSAQCLALIQFSHKLVKPGGQNQGGEYLQTLHAQVSALVEDAFNKGMPEDPPLQANAREMKEMYRNKHQQPPTTTQNGTRVTPFQVTTKKDCCETINLHSITAMSQYGYKSFEELRFEDYSQGNMGATSTSTVPTPAQNGTRATPFQVTTKKDDYETIKLHSITAMSQYEYKSFEELRFEDYSQGNMGATATATSTASNHAGGFLFGGRPAPAPPGTLFGASPPAPFSLVARPVPSGTLFGSPAPGPFGPFGAPAHAQPAPGTFFGAPAPAPFGAAAPAQPALGPVPSGTLFGTPTPGPFGTPAHAQPAPGTFFGAPAPAPFGAPAPAQPAPAPSRPLFGAPAPGRFGAPAHTPFGAPASAFGASWPTIGCILSLGQSAPPAQGGSIQQLAPAPGGVFGTTPTFGVSAPAGGGLPVLDVFGAPTTNLCRAFTAAQPAKDGTRATPFQATTQNEINGTTNLHSITAMPQYKNKSFEELRFEDYAQGNMGAAVTSTLSNQTGGFSFGRQPAPAPSVGLFDASAGTTYFRLRYATPDSLVVDTSLIYARKSGTNQDHCPICLESGLNNCVAMKACGHAFCNACADQFLRRFTTCPICRTTLVEPSGPMPSGTMESIGAQLHLPGVALIKIQYTMEGGIQKNYHPAPGLAYNGTSRTAYLPDTPEGRAVLNRLKYAFSHGLTFGVGISLTTGMPNVITWQSIHHKTSRGGGVHGYPDPNYLSNVNAELDNLGVPKNPVAKAGRNS